jgi:acetyltransferase
MIDELRGAAILKGARGTKPADTEAVVEVLLRLSQLLSEIPEVKELDMNPVRVFHGREGCLALDVRIIVGKG